MPVPCKDDHAHRHEQAVLDGRNNTMSAQTLQDLTAFFKVIGDRTRMRILVSLLDTELCVCALAEVLEMELSAVSHQLRVLKQADLVRSRREGKTVYYSLADSHVQQIIHMGLDHIHEERGNCDA